MNMQFEGNENILERSEVEQGEAQKGSRANAGSRRYLDLIIPWDSCQSSKCYRRLRETTGDYGRLQETMGGPECRPGAPGENTPAIYTSK